MDVGVDQVGTASGCGHVWLEVNFYLRWVQFYNQFYNQIPEAGLYYTDDFKVYDWLPFDKHIKGIKAKAKTNRNEAKHSVLRDKLARLRRKTKAYSKSLLMLCGSIALLAIKNISHHEQRVPILLTHLPFKI